MKHEILNEMRPLGADPEESVPMYEPRPWKMTDLKAVQDEGYRCINGLLWGVVLGSAFWGLIFLLWKVL